MKYLGYKIAAMRDDGYLYSLMMHDFMIGKAKIGSVVDFDKFYLGTSKEFCLRFYSGLTGENEVLLTYEYSGGKNIISGGPPNHPLSEIVVRKAKLLDIQEVEKDEDNNVLNLEELIQDDK